MRDASDGQIESTLEAIAFYLHLLLVVQVHPVSIMICEQLQWLLAAQNDSS